MSETPKPYDFYNFLQALRHDCWKPNIHVVGYAKLLKLSDLDDEQREIVEMLEMFAHRSMEMLHQYVAKGFVYFDDSEKSFYKANLTEIIESAVRGLNDAYGIHQIKVTVPEKSPHISSCGHLHTVFTILRCFEATETMEFRAEIDNAESAVLIQIQMSSQKHLRDNPGSDVDLARNILKKHNSELEIQEENEKTIFRFALPLWQDE